MQADKLFCITTPSLQPYELPHWVPLHDSEALLKSLLEQTPSTGANAPALGGSGGWPLRCCPRYQSSACSQA